MSYNFYKLPNSDVYKIFLESTCDLLLEKSYEAFSLSVAPIDLILAIGSWTKIGLQLNGVIKYHVSVFINLDNIIELAINITFIVFASASSKRNSKRKVPR